ncbi:multiple inositol polyphosphate phosphatase 1b precursor [Danio rerio]|uniref:Multiple inositol polyphosphate phosphatase 1 n=1 Tax=Danio rerio TaxID=7955 RepID=Q7ZUU7_DANRE|nr:multiple inositol polyphosphate phosphatase 1b precursor [Danio rerio]AAH47824.1 Multiple inositol polyphosphate histidine phosphatase, 1 [Danio rerio]AAI65733.1 Minpp1 protein [Danio rerio]|eukprot:NP_957394.1 multiple inositol polyphosphate phosphatase 1 precursor [Danio rerio]
MKAFFLNFITTYLSIMVGLSLSKLAKPTVPSIAHYFGTKGRYEEVNPHLLDDVLFVNKSQVAPPSLDCRAIHMVSVIRHGTRYPTTKNVRKIAQLFDLVKSDSLRLASSWLNDLKTWKMWYTEDMDGRLVEKGRDDHRHLAMRLAKSFPTLITADHLRANRIEFMTSSKHRCVDSVKAFQEGLHRLWDVQDMDYQHYVDDSLMRFFDHCEKFVEGVENNKTALKEVQRFKSSSEMDSVRRKISSRLQIPYDRITADMAEAAFFLCSYEFAIKSEYSPWCELLDESDAQVLEYKNDLKQYWKRGYGHDINRKSSCPLFHDIFSRLDNAAKDHRFGEVKKTATIQVGHGETLLPLLSLMGFFKDEKPLTSENFALQRKRVFRSSKILPYAANVVLVLYECSDGLRVQLFLNEKPMIFPSMNHAAPLYERVRKHYSKLLHGCDFNKECDLPQLNLRNTEL